MSSYSLCIILLNVIETEVAFMLFAEMLPFGRDSGQNKGTFILMFLPFTKHSHSRVVDYLSHGLRPNLI